MVDFTFLDLKSHNKITTGMGSIIEDGVEKAVLTEVNGLDTFESTAVAPSLLHDVILGDQISIAGGPVEATFTVDGLAGIALIEKKFPAGKGVSIITYGMELPLKVLTKSTSLFGKETKVTVYFQKMGGWAQSYCINPETATTFPFTAPAELKWKTAFFIELSSGGKFEGDFPWTISVSVETPLKNLMSPTAQYPDEYLSFGLSETQIITQKLTYAISSTQAGGFTVLKNKAKIRSSAPFEGNFIFGTKDGTETKTIPFADCLQTLSTEIDGQPLVTTPELYIAAGSVVNISTSYNYSKILKYPKYNDKVIL